MTRAEKLGFFGEGPWVEEPDRLEFKSHGLPCLILRNSALGSLCGYVAVPPTHPMHGLTLQALEGSGLDVHGGVTYADACCGQICHVPEPGESDDVHWIGFDAAHLHDLVPHVVNTSRSAYWEDAGIAYRDIAYMRGECERLAAQLVACCRG